MIWQRSGLIGSPGWARSRARISPGFRQGRGPLHGPADRHRGRPCSTTMPPHKHPDVLAWLSHHPRWIFHFTPTSASGLNAVENFFSKMTRQLVRRGVPIDCRSAGCHQRLLGPARCSTPNRSTGPKPPRQSWPNSIGSLYHPDASGPVLRTSLRKLLMSDRQLDSRLSGNPRTDKFRCSSAVVPFNSPDRPANSAVRQRGDFASDPNQINDLQGRVLTCEALEQAFFAVFPR
jgi:hypothetical protein